VIVLGVILIIIGFLVPLPILYTIGAIILVVGVVLLILGQTGRAVGGRKYWY
jgi:membrane-bound ClpP family serine protease